MAISSSSHSSPATVLVAGTSALLAFSAVWAALSPPTKPPYEEDDEITAPEICEIYQKLQYHVQQTMMDFQQQQQSPTTTTSSNRRKQQQQRKMRLEQALQVKWNELLQEYDMEYECLQSAIQDFLSCENVPVKRAIASLETYCQSCLV